MKRTTKMGCLAILALACVGGIYARYGTESASSTANAAESAGVRVAWPVGSELRYRLAWHTSTGVHVLPGKGVQGRIDSGGESVVEGVLVLKVARASAHTATLLASFAELETARFVVSGEARRIVPEETARTMLVGPTAVLEVDDRGRLAEVRTAKDAPAMFADVMHALATELSFELAPDVSTTWSSDERTMTGVAQSTYQLERQSDGVRVERRRDRYTKIHALRSLAPNATTVDGTTRMELRGDGTLASLESGEQVQVRAHGEIVFESKTSLSFELVERAPFALAAGPDVGSFEVHTPGKSRDPRAGDRALTAKFTRDDLLALVSGYAASGSFERGQLARAAAFVRLHPEECKGLEAAFERDGSERGKSIVFDVLTSAGSPEAQAAMRRLLETAHARKDAPVHRMLVQRLALLVEPTAESVAYLRDLERKATSAGDAELANAALVSRGAALGRRIVLGDAEASREARALLTRLRDAHPETATSERLALIKAVGNVHHPDATEALAVHARDGDAEVRASVATALRRAKDPRATGVLFDLMKDTDAYVARNAIESHLGRRLEAKDLDAFAAHVRANGTRSEGDMTLAAAILRHVDTNKGAVRSVLQTLLDRAERDSEQAARLRTAIEELPV